MAKTPSNMLPLGTKAPEFSLPDTVSGETKTFKEVKSNLATVVMFICNHCPFVVHVVNEISKLAKDYTSKGIAFVAISANDAEQYPADSPEKMRDFAKKYKFNFPYLYDESQNVAKAFDAACTPDFYVFDKNSLLVYRGQLDDSRPDNNIPVDGKDLRSALDNIINSKSVATEQKPSIGCNIKWRR